MQHTEHIPQKTLLLYLYYGIESQFSLVLYSQKYIYIININFHNLASFIQYIKQLLKIHLSPIYPIKPCTPHPLTSHNNLQFIRKGSNQLSGLENMVGIWRPLTSTQCIGYKTMHRFVKFIMVLYTQLEKLCAQCKKVQ